MGKARSAKIDKAEDGPELIVDSELGSPPPLDPRIATVLLRTPSNNVTDGYDLHLSATFGKERVILRGGEFEIDVEFSLKTADIELQFVGCTYAVINIDHVEQAKTRITQRSGFAAKTARTIGATGSFSLDGSYQGNARAGASHEKALTATEMTERTVTQRDWQRLGGNTIKVGPVGKMLDGEIVTDLAGWRVKPSSKDKTSGVIARINVRDHWISFDDVQVTKWPARLVQKVKELFLPANWQRKEYFQVLLKHLAQTGLREYQGGKNATIAAHVLLVRPSEDHAVSLYGGKSRGEIAIDGDGVAKFLMTDEGHEAGALIALGVRRDIITPVAEQAPHTPGRWRTVFVPEGSPVAASRAIELIHRAGHPLSRSGIRHQLPGARGALKDLGGLGLVTRDRSGMVNLKVKPGINPDAILRRAVSEAACINVARAVLRINPGASGMDIADAVSLELGMQWPRPATRKRYGNMILRWAVWLEPHRVDPSLSSSAAARVAYATEGERKGKGRPTALRDSLEPDVRRLHAEGVNPSEIARRLNVSRPTIYNWLKSYGLERRRNDRKG
jgi:hypothetical protein